MAALVAAGVAVSSAAPRNRLEDVFLALVGASGSGHGRRDLGCGGAAVPAANADARSPPDDAPGAGQPTSPLTASRHRRTAGRFGMSPVHQDHSADAAVAAMNAVGTLGAGDRRRHPGRDSGSAARCRSGWS